MSNTEFINLSEIYLPTAGGSIDGDVEVGGALQINDGSGAGTNYDVAHEITELKSAWDSVSQNKILFSGAEYMHAGQTITLSEAVSAQPHGIVLVFSGYGSSGDVVYDNGFTSFFVPKSVVANFPGAGHDFSAADTTFTYIWSKRLFINDASITGRAENTSISTNNGVTYDNTSRVLRYVIGV